MSIKSLKYGTSSSEPGEGFAEHRATALLLSGDAFRRASNLPFWNRRDYRPVTVSKAIVGSEFKGLMGGTNGIVDGTAGRHYHGGNYENSRLG